MSVLQALTRIETFAAHLTVRGPFSGIATMTTRILAANMWPAFNFGDANKTYAQFLAVGRPRFKSFIESILLYDEIHVPTDNFMSLGVLLGVLGEKYVLEMLDRGALRFLRFNGAMCYIGNGGGLQPFEIAAPAGADGKSKPIPAFAPFDEALDWMLGGLDMKLNKRAVSDRVLEATTELRLNNYSSTIRDNTYRTILDSSELRRRFAVHNSHMDRLSGVAANGVRMFGGHEKLSPAPGDEIDVVLSFARCFVETLAAEQAGCSSLHTASPMGYVIAADERRTKSPFSTLQQFTDVPDIGEAVLSNALELSVILALRDSRDWLAFRTWFDENCSSDTGSVARAYIELLKQAPVVDTFVGRTLRFIATTAVGIWNPVAGVAAAAADTFLSPKIRAPSAKYFIEKLEQLTDGQRNND